MNIKEIIQILRTATLNSITKKSLSESCLVQFNGICDAVEALKELDKPNIAASPQRTWVGLTDEEINDCLVSADPCECLAEPEARQLVEDVEAKLKGKNT
jgi:hypothetical protein